MFRTDIGKGRSWIRLNPQPIMLRNGRLILSFCLEKPLDLILGNKRHLHSGLFRPSSLPMAATVFSQPVRATESRNFSPPYGNNITCLDGRTAGHGHASSDLSITSGSMIPFRNEGIPNSILGGKPIEWGALDEQNVAQRLCFNPSPFPFFRHFQNHRTHQKRL